MIGVAKLTKSHAAAAVLSLSPPLVSVQGLQRRVGRVRRWQNHSNERILKDGPEKQLPPSFD
jgi:hypothetical protein